MKIKNPNYRKFLDTGIMEIIEEDKINAILDNIKGKYRQEARSLVICMYYTGARPIEILNIKAKDISKTRQHILLNIKGSKRGVPRVVYLKYKLPLVKEFYSYCSSLFEEMLLFYHFRNKYIRRFINNKGEIKEREEITSKLTYYFKRWCKGVIDIPPYYLRHNRLSKLAQKGASDRLLMQLKGAKDSKSVQPYIHMSKEGSKKLAKLID
jgi:site-specific recombinase XerD